MNKNHGKLWIIIHCTFNYMTARVMCIHDIKLLGIQTMINHGFGNINLE